MLKNLFTLFLVFISISASAQFYGWSRSFGGSGTDTCASLAIDSKADLYILGSFSGSGEFRNDSLFDKLSATGGEDIFLQKRSKKGKYIRSKKIGGKGNDRPTSMIYHKGSIYISGTIEDSVDFGIVKVASKGKRTIFIAKMDTIGNFIWVKTIGDSLYSRARSLAINNDGIYLSGEITGKLENVSYINSMFLQKLDFNGNVSWTKTFGTKRSVVSNSITTDSLGNIYNVGGLLGNNVDFNPASNKDSILSITSASSLDIFVQKLNSNGEFKWAFKMGSAAEATSIVIKGDELFLAGNFSSTVDFDPSSVGIKNLTSNGNAKDIFIGKYDLNSKLIWVNQIGSTSEEIAKQLEVDKYKNIYLHGTFSTKNGTSTNFLGLTLSTPGNTDAFLLKFNNLGKGILAKTFGGTKTDFGGAIKADTMQNIYVAGSFMESIKLDPTKTYTSVGANDIFIYKSLLFEETESSSISENSLNIKVYPNPVSDNLYLTFDQLLESATLSITTLNGQTIQSKQILQGQTSENINTNDLIPGIYFVQLSSGINTYTYKIHKI